jgi:predicted dehydrogenase
MKQILQDLSKGHTYLVEAPAPAPSAGCLLITTSASLISSGTERMLVDFGRGSYLQKARQQPEKVRMVMEKARTDGLLPTFDAVQAKLAQPLPLGYCNVGVVADVGRGVEGFAAGDRVLSNGPHADVVKVPQNLCAKIPDGVDDETASFGVLAAIGLQGIRLAGPEIGESVAVIGTGLIGLLAVQLLRAQGCRVLAVDFDAEKLALAKRFGASVCNPAKGGDPVAAGMAFSRGRGMDAVLIATATKSNDPVAQAARMSRKRGRIVLVGVTGLQLNRADFYEKELSFAVSCSYGPGRYDPEYEEKGHDYPAGYVRWTVQRNFEAALDLMEAGLLDGKPLIARRFSFEEAPAAYEHLHADKSGLGILLTYPSDAAGRYIRQVGMAPEKPAGGKEPVLGFVGAGNYASRVLIPAFRDAGARMHTLVSAGGTSSVVHGRKAGFVEASTDVEAMLANDAVNTVVIATRHDTHARFVIRALRAGKHVFVEKPLCLRLEELDEIRDALEKSTAHLMVGFNRRFSPHAEKMKALLSAVSAPKAFIMTVNAGEIPPGHWTRDPAEGGGRIVGEACHFIDLLRFLAGCAISSQESTFQGGMDADSASIQLSFSDGSMGTVHYLTGGSKSFPKERLEVFAAGGVLQLNNFLELKGFGWPGFKRMRTLRQDKGQKACAAAFIEAVRTGGQAPIPVDELLEVSRAAIEAAKGE